MSYLQFLWQNRRLYWYSWKTPGPIGLPYIGIGYKFVSRDISALLQVVYDIQVTYPKVAVAWFGPRLYYLPSKPEYIEKIFKSQAALNKAHVYQFTNDIGDGLLNLGDKVWKIHRRTINQAFNQKVLNTFQDIFLQKSEIFADVLQKEVGNKNIDLYTLLAGCTMDMVCETALGVNMNVQISKEVEFVKAINKVLEITSIRTFHVWHQLRFTWKLYPLSREFDKALKDFEDFLRSVISNKRKDFALKSSRKNCSLQNDKALAVEGRY
ncbi:hypothetical protein C4B38_000326 [Diabrotica virgifera virgifera]|uniref:Cytochrome P450 4C1-like n=1 Tax=Diabrotica virgifera virgifera TaxID=50390 RepID=A0A6P7GI19_DIAVI|nr:hypothetical protein C4B38_000326 [Diabrotica virgifera virgifera]